MAIWKKRKQAPEMKDELIEEINLEVVSKPEPLRRRSETMKLRLSPDELEYITQQAARAGICRTDYIMAAVKGMPVVVIEDLPETLIELRRQGINLNQLARLAHQERSANCSELNAAVKQCMETQEAIRNMCSEWNIKPKKKQGGQNGNRNN